jgi:hypothetical protein
LGRIAERLDAHAAAQLELGVPENKVGLVVTALGIGSQDLWLGDMKASSPGVGLLAVRPPSKDQPTKARLFVIENSLATLERQIDQYGAFEQSNAVKVKSRSASISLRARPS